ncbi:MAG TPA: lasso peptide biosynthesis B2 protein [Gemmatimonadaceae bacterium]|nr:lasso peptide biosynthesis B2 protein [Gemmatimonadaceae bacterium]
MALLAAVKLILLTRGFARTRRLLERWSERSQSSVSDRRLVERIEYSIALGAAFFPGRALCLEQSLALHFLLRRAGVESRLRLGVQPHPFAAHAWVELNGEPVNDVLEHIKHFTPLPDPVS